MNMKLKLLLTIVLVLQSVALFAETPPLAIEFFPVSEQPVPGGRFINTEKLPKVGYIAAKSSLRVTRLLDVSRGESRSSYVGADRKVIESTVTPTLTFSLTKDDAATLAELTAKNVGKRILIQIAGTPVLAPNVQEPIRGGSFSISFKGEELEKMEPLLRKLVEQ